MDESPESTPAWMREAIEKLRDPDSPEGRRVREYLTELGGVIAAHLKPLMGMTSRQMLEALGLPPPEELARIAQRLKEHQEAIQKLPAALQAALAGRAIVHPELSLPDIGAILQSFNEGGEDAAVQKARGLLTELLAWPAFRQGFEERWAASHRWTVMREVLAAFDAGMYCVAIPPALAQVDGIVAEFFELKGVNSDVVKQRVLELHEEKDWLAPSAQRFLAEIFAKFKWGTPTLQMNRHAIAHGADTSYGTRDNAVMAIMWADYVLCLTNEARSRRLVEADGA
jgi:hypothetical protein